MSFWRNAIAGGLSKQEEKLSYGMQTLKKHRDGKARWGRFPFYYTISALIEIETAEALAELKYSAPSAKRCLNRASNNDIISRRRKYILETALGCV